MSQCFIQICSTDHQLITISTMMSNINKFPSIFREFHIVCKPTGDKYNIGLLLCWFVFIFLSPFPRSFVVVLLQKWTLFVNLQVVSLSNKNKNKCVHSNHSEFVVYKHVCMTIDDQAVGRKRMKREKR